MLSLASFAVGGKAIFSGNANLGMRTEKILGALSDGVADASAARATQPTLMDSHGTSSVLYVEQGVGVH